MVSYRIHNLDEDSTFETVKCLVLHLNHKFIVILSYITVIELYERACEVKYNENVEALPHYTVVLL